MNKLNFLQPDKNNLYTYLYTGIILVSLSIFIVFLNSFYNRDLVSFLPGTISFFLPLIIGFIGLHLIRIEYSGLKINILIVRYFNWLKSDFSVVKLWVVQFEIFKISFFSKFMKSSGQPWTMLPLGKLEERKMMSSFVFFEKLHWVAELKCELPRELSKKH